MGTGRSDPTNGNGLSMQKVKNKIKSLPSLRNCNRYPTVSLSSSLSPFAVLGTISFDSFSFPSCQVIFARLSTPLIRSLSLFLYPSLPLESFIGVGVFCFAIVRYHHHHHFLLLLIPILCRVSSLSHSVPTTTKTVSGQSIGEKRILRWEGRGRGRGGGRKGMICFLISLISRTGRQCTNLITRWRTESDPFRRRARRRGGSLDSP